jgi:hypothetical protein
MHYRTSQLLQGAEHVGMKWSTRVRKWRHSIKIPMPKPEFDRWPLWMVPVTSGLSRANDLWPLQHSTHNPASSSQHLIFPLYESRGFQEIDFSLQINSITWVVWPWHLNHLMQTELNLITSIYWIQISVTYSNNSRGKARKFKFLHYKNGLLGYQK